MASGVLSGKVAIITGSSDGIGAGIAFEFAKEGALITLHGRSEEKLKNVAENCEKLSPDKSKPLIVKGDITEEKVRSELTTRTKETFGKIDIVVNNAGYLKASPIIGNADMQALDEMLEIHVRAPYHLTKLAIPELIKTKGVLINISSIAGFRPAAPAVMVEYSMAKAALDQFSQWMARELGQYGIRANSIAPAIIRSNIDRAETSHLPEEEVDKIWNKFGIYHALNRIGQPVEIGKIAVFLASDAASFVTGNVMQADGGMLTMPCGPLPTAEPFAPVAKSE